ncbi:hypothetical protein DSL72_001752 [Monilinia vaccinii-corymbosi]|uniref:Uncharacterized protein n=1 Tax=Monilinia vaccinii-corymbosi TaxID=61207 RepID=A0A8A3PAP7_9HELO|nr:hypothetical protein DSL72_001752 [Monilinia vaccinii-corymbosi]
MLANISYLLTSKSITLYILYTLHVMLGTSLVFTALYTYGVHSSKAMARAAALEASMRGSVNKISMMGKGSNHSGNTVEFEEEMGGLNGIRKAKSMIGLGSGREALENMSTSHQSGSMRGGIKFREVCYDGRVKGGVEGNLPVLDGKRLTVEIS